MTPPPRDPRSSQRPARPMQAAGPATRRTSAPPARRTVALGSPPRRLHVGLVVLILLLATVALRLVQLQGLDATSYAAEAEKQRVRSITLPAPRGEILDRNGNRLATSVAARAVYADARFVTEPVRTARALAPILGLDWAVLSGKVSRTEKSGKRSAFVYLARGVTPEVARKVTETAAELKLPGIGVQPESVRVHPGRDLAANIVGYTNREGQGLAGIESALNAALAGKAGQRTSEMDEKGRRIPSGEQSEQAPVAGRTVSLTLDRDLQWMAQTTLAAKVAETDAVGGSVIVMDPRNGEIYAMATAPTFDADNPSAVPQETRRNSALSDVYEPGSVNKVITAAAALETGIVTPDTPITVPRTIQVSNKVFRDSHYLGSEPLTFTGILAKSSNVGTIGVAQQLGDERLFDYLQRFGFGERTGVAFPGESPGLLPHVSKWSGSQRGTIPIGQGVSVTALQAATVYATVANGGVRVTPRLVRGTLDDDGALQAAPPSASRRVISPATAQSLSRMLEEVTGTEGTAPKAAIPGYRIAGKTGTADRVNPATNRYDGTYTASFVGFAPADAPQLLVQVVLDAPRRSYYGGSVSAPVFRDVMSFALRSLSVPPTGTPPPRLRLTP